MDKILAEVSASTDTEDKDHDDSDDEDDVTDEIPPTKSQTFESLVVLRKYTSRCTSRCIYEAKFC